MQLTDDIYETCSCCGRRGKLLSAATYGCDTCGTLIDGRITALVLTVFRRDRDAVERLELCSWRCVLAKLRTITTDYFVDLPAVHYDGASEGARAEDLLALLPEL